MPEEFGQRDLRRERLVDAGVAVRSFRRSPVIDRDRLRRDLDEIIDPDLEPGPRAVR